MTFGEPDCFTFSHVHHSSLSVLHMSLRTRLDRYCMQRATTTDLPFSPSRSRSPTRAPPSSSTGPSPFHRPTRMATAYRSTSSTYYFAKLTSSQCNNLPIEIHTIISWPRKSLATLLPMNTTGLFQAYKIIYPDYAARHYVGEIKTMVVDIMAQRWSIFLNTTDLYLTVDTEKGQPNAGSTSTLDFHTGIILLGKLINILTPLPIAPLRPCLLPHIQIPRTQAWWFAFKAFLEGIHFTHRRW